MEEISQDERKRIREEEVGGCCVCSRWIKPGYDAKWKWGFPAIDVEMHFAAQGLSSMDSCALGPNYEA